jgi:hypothetical protein
MPYTPPQLAEIKKAERAFWEQCFVSLQLSAAFLTAHNRFTPRGDQERRAWLHSEAHQMLEHWREHFAPERVGEPISPGWDPI